MRAGLLVVLLLSACKRTADAPGAVAVGTYLGGGSMLFGPSNCTYEAPPAVAELSTDKDGTKFMAKLVGEGTIAETCGRNVTLHKVKRPTGIRIEGELIQHVGKDQTLWATAMAGGETLRGIHQGGESPIWTLGRDCTGVADFGPVLGSQDTGGASITRTLRAHNSGTCTVGATVLGFSNTKVITIK